MSPRDSASTFAKGLRVLDCFESGRRDLTMADIARLTGFDRATARRLCLTLQECGYVVREGRALRLSAKVVAVAGGYLGSHDFGKSVQPVLNQYAEDLQGEIALAVLDGTRAIYVARSAVSSARLSLGLSVGSTLPLAPTAAGRMLLALCSHDERDRLMADCDYDRHTESTDTDPASVRAKVEAAAAAGYAFVSGEFETGAAGIAVPVGPVGGAPAVLGTSGTINQFERGGEMERVLDILRKAAMRLRP